jgi:hypothetical protein
LKPKFKKIRKRSQGFTDVNSPWCKARKNWYSQLLIRFGSLPEEELEKLRNPETKLMPAWFDIAKLEVQGEEESFDLGASRKRNWESYEIQRPN